MAQPTASANWSPREDLGMTVEEFDVRMNRNGYVAHRVLPIVTRANTDGKFPVVPTEEVLQNLDCTRNADGSYKRSKMNWGDDNYETDEYGLEAVLDDRTVKRYDDIFDAEYFEGERIENALLSNYEKTVADLLFNATTFSGRTAGVSTEWSVVATATPYTDILTRKKTIRSAFGKTPNALVINWEVFQNLINCTTLIDRLKYQGFQDARPGEINERALAISLDLDEIIVADALYNTKEPGLTASLTDFWSSEYALLCRVARTRNPSEPCLGRTIIWDEEGATEGDRMAVVSEMYYEDQRRGGVLRKRHDWGTKLLFLDAGYLLSNITA